MSIYHYVTQIVQWCLLLWFWPEYLWKTHVVIYSRKWHHINKEHWKVQKAHEDACILSTTCRQLWKTWHANIHSSGLVPEALRAWWLAGSAVKCGYQGPQILTECQILRSYWCTQPATAPDTSQTEPLNVTDKWIFMKQRMEVQEERAQDEK